MHGFRHASCLAMLFSIIAKYIYTLLLHVDKLLARKSCSYSYHRYASCGGQVAVLAALLDRHRAR